MKTLQASLMLFFVAVASLMTVKAHAATITDTFYGTVLVSDSTAAANNGVGMVYTTTDSLGLFGPSGSTLVGDKFIFTLSFTQLTDSWAGQTNATKGVQGGVFYGGSNPLTTTLQIGSSSNTYAQIAGLTQTGPTYNTGDIWTNGSDGTIGIQEFNWSGGIQQYAMNIYLGGISTSNQGLFLFGPALPPMQASDGDFTKDCSTWSSCSTEGRFDILSEDVALHIDSINTLPAAATPEPSSLILLGTGLVGLATIARRKLSM